MLYVATSSFQGKRFMNTQGKWITPSRGVVLAVVVAFLAIGASISATAQSWVAEAQQAGFTLKKVVSDTAIQTGQTFSYTIYFSIPAGATNVTISDALPTSLEFLGASYTSPCGTPTVVSPTVGGMGGTYSLSWASVPGGCSGSFTITVRFPNGVTCNNTTARNRVCLNGTIPGQNVTDLCTPFVSTRAIATDPWHINKYVTGAAYVGGSCPYATADSVVSYQVCVYKDVGTTGQLNLVNGVVTDVLPTGAVLQSSSCGATQSGNTITWNVGNLSATSMYTMVCCTFNVLYPRALFPLGSQVTNTAVLNGSLGPATQPCGTTVDTSNQTCVSFANIASATISKWVYTNRQPGCPGKYLVYICNNGSSPISSFTVTDTVPTALSSPAIGTVSPGLNATIVGNIVTVTSTSALGPGQCRWFEITFTIPSTATVGSTITNCAWFASTGMPTISGCNSFTVAAPAPTACVWKEVCNEQPSYTPGSIFRYRLRVQNIGGTALSGTTITDVLNGNLQYIGNPSFYTGTAWNAPCQTTSNWTGVGLTHNAVSNTVTATLPSIPATCQNIFYTNCGMYGTGGVPYYFIEFDVKVVDTSALGNIPNQFTLSGGTLPAPVNSNIEYVTVVGTAGFTLDKGVKPTGPGSYGSSATTSAGGSVSYRLRLNVASTSVGLRHVTFADLLPRDNGASDQLILGPCSPRGSAFDVAWASALGSSPTATSWNNATSFARVNNFAPTGAPGAMFVGGCGTAGTWTSGIPASAKNLGYYFGSTPIAATFSATSDFTATVAASATDNQQACNTFAANAAVRHLIASSIISDQIIGQLESTPACVTVKKTGCLDSVQIVVNCAGKDAAGNQQYSFVITGWNAAGASVLMLNSPQGTFSPSTFALSPGAFSITSTFTDIPPVDAMITMHYQLVVNGQIICRDSIIRDLPPCPQEPPQDCCKEFIRQVRHDKLTYDNAGNVTLQASMIAGPTPIKEFTATIVSVQRRQVCVNSAGPWHRAFGDITAGSLSVPLGPGPLLLSLYSREATWGPGECLPFGQGTTLNLNMIFPPPPASFKCRDTIIFAIRYTFTDCKCVTCTRLVYDTIVRKPLILPWDPVGGGIGIGIGTGRLATKKIAGDGADGDVQAEAPATTRIIMDDDTDGALWIVNPDSDENTITVLGAEVTSSTIPLSSISIADVTGVVNGATGFVSTSVAPGANGEVALKFNNPSSTKQWQVSVRYLYDDGGDVFAFSEPVTYLVRAPGAAPDEVAGDPTIKPTAVNTYALRFRSSNGYNSNVAAIRLTSTSAARILAVGPAEGDGETVTVTLTPNETQTAIAALPSGYYGVEPNTDVTPIYLTLSNVENAGAVPMRFETFDSDGQLVSEGTFTLEQPVMSVEQRGETGDVGARIIGIAPNPSGNVVTVTVAVDADLPQSEIVIVASDGRTVLTLSQGPLHDGSRMIITQEINKLAQGSYNVVLRTPRGSTSLPLRIIR